MKDVTFKRIVYAYGGSVTANKLQMDASVLNTKSTGMTYLDEVSGRSIAELEDLRTFAQSYRKHSWKRTDSLAH